jgi:stage II sporulation protein R
VVFIFTKDKKIIIISIAMGLIVSILVSAKNYSDTMQSGIAEKVIRFHVLANSNEEIDQDLKLNVRDAILDKYGAAMSNFTSIDESRKFLQANILNIQEYAGSVIQDYGFSYKAKASLQNTVFPTKFYDGYVFPPGQYEALRIEIGEAKGENWWCVMFPPLCFVDITQANPSALNQPNGNGPYFKGQAKLSTEASMPTQTNDSNKLITNEKIAVNKDTNEKTNKYTEDKIGQPKITEAGPLETEDKVAVMPGKSRDALKSTLSDSEYDLITNSGTGIKAKFKIVEFWQNAKNKI